MVKEALLRRIEGLDEDQTLWARGGSYETGLATLARWVEFATCRGFAVTRQPGLDGSILSQDGGQPYRIVNPRAVTGHDVFFVLVWEE